MAAPTIRSLRSPLGRVRGLGAAKGGTHHWWLQRVTSMALLPLTIWFTFGVAGLAGAPYERVLAWIGHPFHAVLLLLYIGIGFHHTAAGLQVVIEDYIHDHAVKTGALLANTLLTWAFGLAGVFAVAKIAFTA